MAKSRTSQQAEIEIKKLSLQEIDRGVANLKRRIEEVRVLDPKTTRRNDAAVRSVEHSIQSSILEIFGLRSPEYLEYKNIVIWHSQEDVAVYGGGYDEQQCFADGIPYVITILENLVKRLEEKRIDLAGSPADRAKATLEGLDLHSRIAEACVELYKDEHYPNAVFDAAKALINYVKEKSRRDDLDGADLVRTVFSKKKPILAFNELRDPSDLDEQEGLMHLFEGVVFGVRNPRGHSFLNDSPERALEYIALVNLLAHRLQGAKRINQATA